MREKTEKVKVQRNRKRIYEIPTEAAIQAEERQAATALTGTVVSEVTVESAPPESDAPMAIFDQSRMERLVDRDRFQDALNLVRKHSAWASGAGIVPIPVIDIVAMTAVQIAMLKKLADLYDIAFSEQRSKSAVAALIGAVNAGCLGGSALKMFPLFGVISLLAMPAANWAITYAVGRVFIQHFSTGGSFLNFDPAKVKAFFEEQFKAGKLKRLKE